MKNLSPLPTITIKSAYFAETKNIHLFCTLIDVRGEEQSCWCVEKENQDCPFRSSAIESAK